MSDEVKADAVVAPIAGASEPFVATVGKADPTNDPQNELKALRTLIEAAPKFTPAQEATLAELEKSEPAKVETPRVTGDGTELRLNSHLTPVQLAQVEAVQAGLSVPAGLTGDETHELARSGILNPVFSKPLNHLDPWPADAPQRNPTAGDAPSDKPSEWAKDIAEKAMAILDAARTAGPELYPPLPNFAEIRRRTRTPYLGCPPVIYTASDGKTYPAFVASLTSPEDLNPGDDKVSLAVFYATRMSEQGRLGTTLYEHAVPRGTGPRTWAWPERA